MKELSLYRIRDIALESGRAVYSIQQLANLLGKPNAICRVYAARLVKKGLAVRLLKGKISFEKDDFIIASQLVEPSYISLNSALLFHGLITQVQKNIECVTPVNTLKFEKLGLTYHKIPGSFFYGFEKYSKGRSYMLVATPEKAVLDGVYLNLFSEKDVRELAGSLDMKKLSALAKKFEGRGKKKMERVIKNAGQK